MVAVEQDGCALQYAKLQNSEASIKAYIQSIQSYIFRKTLFTGMKDSKKPLHMLNNHEPQFKILCLGKITEFLGISFDGNSTESFTVKQRETAYLAASNLSMNITALPINNDHTGRSEAPVESNRNTNNDMNNPDNTTDYIIC